MKMNESEFFIRLGEEGLLRYNKVVSYQIRVKHFPYH